MLHIFKLNGHRCAYDTLRGTTYPLSALALKILDGLTPPLTDECPSALRYAYAKYDSRDLSEAYAELYALYKKGLLFAPEEDIPTPATLCTVLSTSAEAADAKISSAIAEGAKTVRVFVSGGTVCRLTSLFETYGSRVSLTLITDIPADLLSDADIATLNAIGCYITAPLDGSFAASIFSLADRGASYIYADLPAGEAAQKDIQRLAKEMERRAEAGKAFSFGPFVFATVAEEGFTPAAPACADCFARAICGGKCLDAASAQTVACDTRRLVIECAITLADAE